MGGEKVELRAGVDYIGVAAAFYCHDGRGNFLLHLRGPGARDEIGRWDFGAEQMEFSESPLQTALRGVRKEYGCQGIIQEQLPAHSIVREQDGVATHWLIIPFFVWIRPEEVRVVDRVKIEKLGWFPINSLPEPLHSGVRQTMSMLTEYFAKYRVR